MSEIISCTHKVTLDIAKRDVHMIQVIYGDTANILEVNLCENGKEISLENATLATITYSNNTFDEMQISEDYRTASARINANCLKQGLNFAQISIYSGDNGLITADMLTIDCNQKIGGENPSCPNADMPKLKELINQLIQQGMADGISPEQIADAVANYLAKNPIEETDPNVHEWAKAKEKPTYTAEEVGALSDKTLKPAVDLALARAKASGEFDGADGLTPTIGENGNWYLGDTDTGKPSRGERGPTGAQGEKGDTGAKGDKGETGATGAAGKSAYQYAQDGGYIGTEAEFAAKLAKEKFVNPNALTFTGAVEGSYDGSEPLTVEIPSGGSDAWNLIDHITAEDAAISYEIPLQPGAKEYGIYWRYTNKDIPQRDIAVDESLANFGVMYRCLTNEDLFLRVFKGPSNILVLGQNTAYAAQRCSNGGTYIGSGTDFPAMTLKTNTACTTSEIWVYWR